MDPKQIHIEDFDYSLPGHLIAKHPLKERDASRLLIYKNKSLEEDIYSNLDRYLQDGSLMILNNTRVVAARIHFQKLTGGIIEIFCLEPEEEFADVQSAMQQTGFVRWKCLIGGASKWKSGQLLIKTKQHNGRDIQLEATFIAKMSGDFLIQLSWLPDNLTFAAILEVMGEVPLPPYLDRDADSVDSERYQTVYAENAGSVAAPTAGLHFSQSILSKLKQKNIEQSEVTLHVGAGTFLPVKTARIGEHNMHAEWLHVKMDTIEKLIKHLHQPIIAVGTTSLRTLESLYWIGVKLLADQQLSPTVLMVQQWEGYESSLVSAKDALSAILEWLKKNEIEELVARTKILIAPGYVFRVTNVLITNFHQPRSTLLLLIAAFTENNWKEIYEVAISKQFRFLSYGDGCLLFRNKSLP